jgi:hypothetical protein
VAAATAERRVCATCAYTTVQAAVDVADPGDTIKIATGLYTDVHEWAGATQVVYISKSITLSGGYSPANWAASFPLTQPSTLDAQQQGRVIRITGAAVRIEGLKLTGGQAANGNGGGIHSTGDLATANCTIEGNRALGDNGGRSGGGFGGGIYSTGTLVITECVLASNQAIGGKGVDRTNGNRGAGGGGGGAGLGGGIFSDGGMVSITASDIVDNQALGGAGGSAQYPSGVAYASGGNGGGAGGAGGGSGSPGGNGDFGGGGGGGGSAPSSGGPGGAGGFGGGGGGGGGRTSGYTGGSGGSGGFGGGLGGQAEWSGGAGGGGGAGIGGGIFSASGTLFVRDSTIRSNGAQGGAGGAGAGGWGTGGSGSGIGGGLYLESGSATLVNAVLADNRATSRGSGLYAAASQARLTHVTVARNSLGEGSGVYVSAYGSVYSTVTLTNTVFVSHSVGIKVTSGNTAALRGVLWHVNGLKTDGLGTISVIKALSGDPAFAADGYHLQSYSPAIDQGIDAGIAIDIDGHLRPQGLAPDLGADEWAGAPVIPVPIDPGLGGTLVYTDPQGLPTIAEIPTAAVREPFSICFSPLPGPSYALPMGIAYAGHSFDLGDCSTPGPLPFIPVGGTTLFPSAPSPDHERHLLPRRPYLPLILRNKSGGSTAVKNVDLAWDSPVAWGTAKPLAAPSYRGSSTTRDPGPACFGSIIFDQPITITIHYSSADVQDLDEGNLRLLYWTGSSWQDAAGTCSPTSNYLRDPANNVLQVQICHLSEFAFGG